MAIKQRITNCLWFDGQAEQAANFYIAVFKNSKITGVSRYLDTGPGPKGSVMTVGFELDGQSFVALNGGPLFKFSEAISMIVNCEPQGEVDYYWERLSAHGRKPGQCGWLEDKFGVSWQIVPTALIEMATGKEPEKSERMMKTMMGMTKIDIAALKKSYDGV
jgi:predicted 3-demethylubiquinone-9 3-methyltransferase (glyoxalase superfamily)